MSRANSNNFSVVLLSMLKITDLIEREREITSRLVRLYGFYLRVVMDH